MKNWLELTKKNNIDFSSTDTFDCINIDSLNREQKFAYDTVNHHLNEEKQLLMIMIGEGGTGKTFTINAISQLLGIHLLKCAPTAKAAFLIKGETCHRLFSITPKKKFSALENQDLFFQEVKFKKIKFIVIDEFSMLSQEMFGIIDKRLRQIKKKNRELFGGLSIILTGDLGQLNPVGGSSLYSKSLKTSYLQLQGFHSFKQFKEVVRLESLMRQTLSCDIDNDQKRFIELLPRLRNGQPTEDDWKLLMTRTSNIAIDKEFKDATNIFPTNNQVNERNELKLKELEQKIVRLKAINSSYIVKNSTSDNFNGLENELYLAIQAKIQLTSNLWTSTGLTNGQHGVIQDIIYPDSYSLDSLPETIIVHFPNYIGPQFFSDEIKHNWLPLSTTTIFCDYLKGSRTQYPLRLAYALTIHKCQGQTIDKCVIDIGTREISAGLTYVAFSR